MPALLVCVACFCLALLAFACLCVLLRAFACFCLLLLAVLSLVCSLALSLYFSDFPSPFPSALTLPRVRSGVLYYQVVVGTYCVEATQADGCLVGWLVDDYIGQCLL